MLRLRIMSGQVTGQRLLAHHFVSSICFLLDGEVGKVIAESIGETRLVVLGVAFRESGFMRGWVDERRLVVLGVAFRESGLVRGWIG